MVIPQLNFYLAFIIHVFSSFFLPHISCVSAECVCVCVVSSCFVKCLTVSLVPLGCWHLANYQMDIISSMKIAPLVDSFPRSLCALCVVYCFVYVLSQFGFISVFMFTLSTASCLPILIHLYLYLCLNLARMFKEIFASQID